MNIKLQILKYLKRDIQPKISLIDRYCKAYNNRFSQVMSYKYLKYLAVSICIGSILNSPTITKAQTSQTLAQQETQNSTIKFLTPDKQKILTQRVNVDKPKIQVAILLDSSNSMDGLIDQARTQIWSVINALSKVNKNGNAPIIEVSLYHYGNDTLPSAEGFNRMLNELTTDLDLISENLFSIKTKGGQEYAGWVIDSAMKQLKWSDNLEDFRVIFIAGNEPFSQGTVDWQKAIDSALAKDVIVNSIYCGNSETRESNLWATAANQGKGSYFNLNQNQKITFIPTPYDDEIARLNRELNQTYIPYGVQGQRYLNRQQEQDRNAFSRPNSSAGYSRAVSKVSGNYRNSNWDLVDAVADNKVDLNAIDKSLLPENLSSMPIPIIEEKIAEMTQKRAKIRAEIAELAKKRAEYISKNTPKTDVDKTLDNLMISALYKQLEAKNFEIKE